MNAGRVDPSARKPARMLPRNQLRPAQGVAFTARSALRQSPLPTPSLRQHALASRLQSTAPMQTAGRWRRTQRGVIVLDLGGPRSRRWASHQEYESWPGVFGQGEQGEEA